MSLTTTTASRAWAADVVTFRPDEVVPDALLIEVTDIAGIVEGDDPLLRVPFVVDAPAGVVAEDAPIPEANPELAEALISTVKVAQLLHVSREQMWQPDASKRFAQSASRAVTTGMNALLINRPAPTAPNGARGDELYRGLGPTGLLNSPGVTKGAKITTALDALHDAVASIETAGGEATHVLASPKSWAALSKLKATTDSAMNLLGAGTQATPRMVLSRPVLVTTALPDNSIIVLDRAAIVSAAGDVQVAQSEHSSFARDAVDIRVTWRAGWALMRPGRVVALTI